MLPSRRQSQCEIISQTYSIQHRQRKPVNKIIAVKILTRQIVYRLRVCTCSSVWTDEQENCLHDHRPPEYLHFVFSTYSYKTSCKSWLSNMFRLKQNV